MFNNKRYITIGVQSVIDLEIQQLLWDCIEKIRKEINIDYLQVFELEIRQKGSEIMQRIIHKQEIPRYKRVHLFKCQRPVKEKVFVIDDGDHTTMLLASEY